MQLFFTDIINDTWATFDQVESGHMIQSLRKKTGDEIDFTDGLGHHFKGIIVEADRKHVKASITSSQRHTQEQLGLSVVMAPTKQHERMEWMVEKCVEMGVLDITIVGTKRSERNKVRLDRLQKIGLSAMKQSLQFFLPTISYEPKFSKVLLKESPQKFIAVCLDQPLPYFGIDLKPSQGAIVLVGPEGDFTPDEVDSAAAAGYSKISLGQNRLRTETAAIFAAATYKTINKL